jgi:6-phosphogluconolactonase (cycloisomerase 2 family)
MTSRLSLFRRGVVAAGLVAGCLLANAGVAFATTTFQTVSGSPFAVGSYAREVAWNPAGTMLAESSQLGWIYTYSVSAGGAVTPLSSLQVGSGSSNPSPQAIAWSPSGNYVAVGNQGSVNNGVPGSVSMFSVSAGGVLTQVPGSPFATGGYSDESVAFSADGSKVAAAQASSNAVAVFTVGAGGVLTAAPGSPFPTGAGPYSVAFGPTGVLAVGDESGSAVSMFTVASNGVPTAVTGSPFSTGANTYPASVAFSPYGGLLATANNANSTLGIFSVSASGALTQVSGSPYAVGSSPYAVAFSPSGGLVATINNQGYNVSAFSVAADGTLTPTQGSPYAIGASGSNPTWLTFGNANGLLAVADNIANKVSMFQITPGPANSTLPSISGTSAVGQTLSASTGTWTNNPTSYLYQWQDCDSLGDNCVPITGATSSTYIVTGSDLGATINVIVTALNPDAVGNASAPQTSQVTPPAPINTTAPSVSGTTTQGNTLSATTGTWDDPSATLTYQWEDCDSSGETCTPIAGATASTYTLTASDVGYMIRVIVTATDAGSPGSAASPSIGPATGSASTTAPTPVASPTPSPSPEPTPATSTGVSVSQQDLDAGLTVNDQSQVEIGLECPQTATGCDADGTLAIQNTDTLAAGESRAAAAAERVLARFAGVRIASGKTRLLAVQLDPATVRDLQRRNVRRVLVTLTVDDHLSGGTPVQTVEHVWLKIPAALQLCHAPTGSLIGSQLGPLALGETQAAAHQELPHYNKTHNGFDNFCLDGGWGIRVAYGTPTRSGRSSSLNGKVVLALTANDHYTLDGIKPHTPVAAAARVLLGSHVTLGQNDWYFVPAGSVTGVLKVRDGVIQEVGIAVRSLTVTPKAQRRFLRSLG